MHDPKSNAEEKGIPWDLAPGDLPAEGLIDLPHFDGLAHNAVFRMLVHQNYRFRRGRVGMLAGFALAWAAIVPVYCLWLLGAALDLSFIYAAGLLVVVGLGIGIIYIHAGIEGFETNGALKASFFDIIAAGVPAEDIAKGIWGKTATHYRVGLIRIALAFAAALLLGLVLALDRRAAPPFMGWIFFLGAGAAAHLFGVLRYIGYVTLPGTRLWYRGVRQGYERRLAEHQGSERSFFVSTFRLILFLSISLSVVLVPVALYLLLGTIVLPYYDPAWDEATRSRVLVAAFSGYLLLGALTSSTVGWWAKRTTEKRFERLVAEIDRLFAIRGEVLFGG